MRLRTRQHYRWMTQKTLKFTGEWIIVDIRTTQETCCRLGIIVTKRYGAAHHRNRFKRIAREAFRLSYSHFPLPLDVLIRPRSQALIASLSDIQHELLFCVKNFYSG